MPKFIQSVVWLIIPVPAVYLAIVWNSISDKIALHFNSEGVADRFGNREELAVTIISMVGINILVYLVLSNVHRIDPKKSGRLNKSKLQRIGLITALLISSIGCLIIYGGVTEQMKFNISLVFAVVSLVFAFIGNHMYNLKPNYFAGIRLPWTLSNDENWRKTHLLSGKLWFFGGIVSAILCLLLPEGIGRIIFFAEVAVLSIVPTIYSYRLFKSQKNL